MASERVCLSSETTSNLGTLFCITVAVHIMSFICFILAVLMSPGDLMSFDMRPCMFLAASFTFLLELPFRLKMMRIDGVQVD